MKTTRLLLTSLLAAGTATVVLAKLPPPSDEAKAKAAEAAAKAAWTGKVDAYKLCQAMDRVASNYLAQVKKAGSAASAPVATPPCADPGPFAYAPAEPQRPIEAAGAHSPAATAASPPGSTAPAAAVAPKQ